MKTYQYQLNIDNPCHQDWSSMDNVFNGRYCNHCSQTVIDFSQLTDQQILQIIEKNQGKLCGRFQKDQLNRNLQAQTTSRRSRLLKIFAGLLLVGAKNPAHASDLHLVSIETTLAAVEKANSKTLVEQNLQKDTDTIKNLLSGKVLDSITQEPIHFAVINIAQTTLGTYSEVDGSYRLSIPDSLMGSKITLVITYVGHGYNKMEVTLDPKELPSVRNIFLSPYTLELALTGAVVVVKKKKKWWQWKRKRNR